MAKDILDQRISQLEKDSSDLFAIVTYLIATDAKLAALSVALNAKEFERAKSIVSEMDEQTARAKNALVESLNGNKQDGE